LETQIATLILFCKDQFETTSKMEKTSILPALVLLLTITVCAGFPQGGDNDEFYFINDVVREHNKIRRDAGLPEFTISTPMEDMLAKVGYNTKRHGHSQYNNLKAYAGEVSYVGTTPTTTFAENVATNSPRRHSAAALVDGWMNSPDHKKNILNRELHYIACTVGSRGNNYSYICAFHGKYSNECSVVLFGDRGKSPRVNFSDRPYSC